MKKILTLALLALAMLLVLASCDMPGNSTLVDVTVNDDGYVVVNGIETKYKVETEDEITVSEDGYVVVNGNKTEHKIHTEPEISVIDGYVAINGVKTEYEVNTADEITVEDGYVVVNGIKTEHKVHTEPKISVIDGYIAINGIKTEYEVNTADEITVEDGYVVVNGNKTEHKVHTEPEISVIDGYIAINGVKTEYEVKIPHVHSYGEWELYNNGETDCEKKLYHRICATCSNIEWKDGTYQDHNFTTITTPATCQAGGYDTKTCQNCGKVEVCNETPIADHTFASTYTTDNNFHWFKCQFCSAINGKAEHTLDDNGICTACNMVIGATEGVLYGISADGIYAEVIGYTGTATRVRIAEEYNGLPVKVIYREAFKNNRTITSVIIPDSVISIDDSAFEDCSCLKSVTMGDSVTSIGYFAFDNCTSLTSVHIVDLAAWSNIKFSDSSSNPLRYAHNLYLNGNMVTELVIPDSVTSIGDYVFYRCTSLTSVTIPGSVTIIGNRAFAYCTSLTSVTIPDSVTSTGEWAFYSCTALTSVTIPDSVTSIGNYVFWNCTSLTSVTIPDSVTSIGSCAFSGCTSLTSVTIPDSVTSIGNSAFSGCTSLTSVTFANPNGWWYANSADATSGTAIPADSLSNPATATKYLKSTYRSYYWFRTE